LLCSLLLLSGRLPTGRQLLVDLPSPHARHPVSRSEEQRLLGRRRLGRFRRWSQLRHGHGHPGADCRVSLPAHLSALRGSKREIQDPVSGVGDLRLSCSKFVGWVESSRPSRPTGATWWVSKTRPTLRLPKRCESP